MSGGKELSSGECLQSGGVPVCCFFLSYLVDECVDTILLFICQVVSVLISFVFFFPPKFFVDLSVGKARQREE